MSDHFCISVAFSFNAMRLMNSRLFCVFFLLDILGKTSEMIFGFPEEKGVVLFHSKLAGLCCGGSLPVFRYCIPLAV